MSFDKIKAMRNAERFLAQGKIRAAINEYKRVVENDSKDFSTLNMLGDLYAKASDTSEAVNCFTQVAEYYGRQGFSQKAIAIYNKIKRLTPDSLEVSEKLAQLYQSKGSIAEARTHYANIAEQYQRTGKKAEALTVLKQIADLDTTNTEIYLKIAEAYWQDKQKEEAADAFIESGKRLSAKHLEESAAASFSRALEIRPNDLQALNGFVKSHISLGFSDEAAKALENVLEKEPYNREILCLLIDCHIDSNNAAEAEKAVIKLVEKEPANYPKFLNVVELYFSNNNLDSAARLLSMSTEHLLVGGQAAELKKWVDEILGRSPEHLTALRLLVQYHGFQRDQVELKNSLERMAEAAHLNDSHEDERYALSQLVMISPHETAFASRLYELNQLLGTMPAEYENPLMHGESGEFEDSAVLQTVGANAFELESSNGSYGEFVSAEVYPTGNGAGNGNGNGHGITADDQFTGLSAQPSEIVSYDQVSNNDYPSNDSARSAFDQSRLQQELESVDYYILQNYHDLAAKSLEVLEKEFGKCPEIEAMQQRLNSAQGSPAVGNYVPETVSETVPVHPSEFETASVETNEFLDFTSYLDLEETEITEHGDYDTHYHLGIAYKEMGLMEDSVREFQDAVKLVKPGDGTRRYLLCCNLLGHCFMEMRMPNLALMWYERCFETANLTEQERLGLRYEIANAYQEDNEMEKAVENFEEIYALDVEYRDVGERLMKLRKKMKRQNKN